jgi:hypothetical protein
MAKDNRGRRGRHEHRTGEREAEYGSTTMRPGIADHAANLAIPGGSELIGMWGGEWDMKRKSFITYSS